MTLFWIVLILIAIVFLAYHQASLLIYSITLLFLLLFQFYFSGYSFIWLILSIIYVFSFSFLLCSLWRRKFISRFIFKLLVKRVPTLSRTEQEAIAAGTIAFEADLFQGDPDWNKLFSYPEAKLSQEEQAFLDGPVENLCAMINDWEITHHRMDLSPEVWAYLKREGFFGLIIPKKYGGKEFSAYAHSQILIKLGTHSVSAAITASVPNSLGPAELLLHYGTEEQKNYYLPRLASGEEIPCFALTSEVAGSDAGSMTDRGVVCYRQYDNQQTLGILLNFNKRYITLAPLATVIGLAFKLYDPEHLLGEDEDLGITCALIPRQTPGIEIGRRHFPLNMAFMNGPIKGKDVFIPIDWIIGGKDNAGKGWGMLMECLAVGRAISLPASASSASKVASAAVGAYARIRRQFNQPIGKFEGVAEPLTRIVAATYLIDAACSFTTALIDQGEKPAIASAILKYYTTEIARQTSLASMDILAGKGICLGPNNFFARIYQAIPIAITVEGSNILTRNMIIFGQGSTRCHPYLYKELTSIQNDNKQQGLTQFDKLFFEHVGYVFSRAVRSLFLGLSGSFLVQTPESKLKRYYQHATRFSSALAFLSDCCFLVYGDQLKRKESVSARLADILSYLYLLSSLLKKYHDQGEIKEDLPIVKYAALNCLAEIQLRFDEILINFPNRWLAFILRLFIFPLGRKFSKPRDSFHHQISQLILTNSKSRNRLINGVYLGKYSNLGKMEDALVKIIACEPLEDKIKQLVKEGKIHGDSFIDQINHAFNKQLITQEEFNFLNETEEMRHIIIQVDDFSQEELSLRLS